MESPLSPGRPTSNRIHFSGFTYLLELRFGGAANEIANCCAFGGSGSGATVWASLLPHTLQLERKRAISGWSPAGRRCYSSVLPLSALAAAFLSHFNMSVAHLVGVADWAGQKAKASDQKKIIINKRRKTKPKWMSSGPARWSISAMERNALQWWWWWWRRRRGLCGRWWFWFQPQPSCSFAVRYWFSTN